MKRLWPLLLLILYVVSSLLYATDDWPEIDAQTLKSWLRDGVELEIIDVRSKYEFQSGTLPGAVNAGADPMGYLPAAHTDPVILIKPASMHPTVVMQWVSRLQNVGNQVRVLSGGIDAWVASGEKLEEPDSYYPRPGTVPFLIPKGLCETGEPARVYQ